MDLFFCEKCGKRITGDDVRDGTGKLVGGLAWCATCMGEAPEAPPALPPRSRQAGRPAGAARRPPAARGPSRAEAAGRQAAYRGRPPPEQAPESRSLLPVIAVAGGVGLGVLVGAIVFWSGGGTDPAPAPPRRGPSVERPTPAPLPSPAPAPSPATAARPAPPGTRRAATPSAGVTTPPETTRRPAPPPAPVRQALFVTISNPRPGALFKPGSDITLKAMAMGGDGEVSRIEFLRDGEKIGEAAGTARSFTWRSAPEGTYRLTARAFDGSGASAESDPVQVTVAPTKAVAGYFVEAESGRTNMQTESTDQGSGGGVVKGNRTSKEVVVGLEVTGTVRDASVAVRNVGWGSQNGQLEVSFGPSAGGLAGLGRIDCRGGWKWKRVATGKDLAPGTYRVKLRVPNERGGGAFDVVGIVSGRAELPNRLVDGRLEDKGWTVEVGRSVSVSGSAGGNIAGGAGGSAPAPARARVSDERAALANLAKRFDKDKVAARKLASIGGAVAGSTYFDSLLKKELPRRDGYAFAGKTSLAGSGRTAAGIRKGLEGTGAANRRLDYEKPEVVRICFDLKDAVRLRDAAQLEADVTFIAEELLDRGAAPVIFTLFAGPQRSAEAQALVASFNDTLTRVAGSLKLPLVDAWGILNADRSKLGSYFSPTGQPRPAAFDAVNAKFVELYRKLEAEVLARDRASARPPRIP